MIDDVIRILMAVILILSVIFSVKNLVTFINRSKINDAIFLYRCQCYRKNDKSLVSFDGMESYLATMFRLWDWGYKHILPPEKFEIIKPFIKNKKEIKK